MELRVIFFGEEAAGKSRLVHRLVEGPLTYNPLPHYSTTLGADPYTINRGEVSINIWDLSGAPNLKRITSFYYNRIDVACYCIDMSKNSLDANRIGEDILGFRAVNPSATLILVGTKCDDEVIDYKEYESKLLLVDLGEPVYARVVTSVQKDIGVDKISKILLDYLPSHSRYTHANTIKTDFDWDDAVEQLLKQVPKKKRAAIQEQTNNLFSAINTNFESNDKLSAIDHFTANCHQILEGKHPTAMKTAMTIATIVVVTVVVALIGFFLGMLAGAWAGPGAFFSALLLGSAAAVSVVPVASACGLISGGIVGYGLFKEKQPVMAVNLFAEKQRQAEVEDAPLIL